MPRGFLNHGIRPIGIAAALTLLSVSVAIAGDTPLGGLGESEPLARFDGFVGGTWVGEEILRAGEGGRPFRSVRVYEWQLSGKVLLATSYYQYEDDGSREPNLINWTFVDPRDGAVLHYGVFEDAGVIDGRYVASSDASLEIRFTYTDAEGERSEWKAVEIVHGPDHFTEDAFIMKDGEWQRVNTLNYRRARESDVDEPDRADWRLVYSHDENGQPIDGSKDELIAAVRRGQPVRVYARGTRVEHSADALFLTVLDGEVFAQIAEIQSQLPSVDPPTVTFREPGQYWRAIYGTTGAVEALMDGNEVRSNRAGLSWFVQE